MRAGAATRPVDVSPTGSASGYVPQPVTTAPRDWSQNPYVQTLGGFLGGLSLGAVPFAGVGHEVADAAGALSHGSPEARRGMAVGQIMGGLFSLVGGLAGEVGGGIAHRDGHRRRSRRAGDRGVDPRLSSAASETLRRGSGGS